MIRRLMCSKEKALPSKKNVKKTHLKIFRAKCKETAPLGTWLGGQRLDF